MEAFPYNNRIAVRSGHGVGKSALMSWLLPLFITTRTPAKVMCTAPSAHQLYDILWAELSIWQRKALMNFQSLTKITTDSFYLIGAQNENFANCRTARKDQPEALQGAHSENMMFLIDEASGIPEIIFETAEGSMSTEGAKVLMFSNPTRTSGYFFNAFHKNRINWTTFKVSCTESSQVRQGYIDEIARTYGLESNMYKIRVLGEFPNSSDDSVIPLDSIERAVDRGIDGFGQIVWGVDVGRYGRDRSALAKRQGAKAFPLKVWGKKDLMETAGIIFNEWENTLEKDRPYKIMIDVIGLGAGVCDRLNELKLPVVGVNVAESVSWNKKHPRLRDELWWKVREWFDSNQCDIPDDPVLMSELAGPNYKILSNGQVQVESKDSMKERGLESPDGADAFCLTFCKDEPKVIKPKEKKHYAPAHWMAV